MGRGFSSQDLLNHRLFKQNINFDNMVDEDFILCQHNTLLITRSDLSKLFESLISPPTNKIETEMYERIFVSFDNDFSDGSTNSGISISCSNNSSIV